MSDKSKIEWTEATWNPLRGCSKVSAGCRNCYAEGVARRFSGAGMPYEGTITDGRWNGQIRLVPEVLDKPLRWQRPRRIFVNSMSDLFHPEVPQHYIDQVFGIMLASHMLDRVGKHTFQILTKRPERMKNYLSVDPRILLERWAKALDGFVIMDNADVFFSEYISGFPIDEMCPLPNVWLGVSVEDQKAADERIPLLLETPAAVRWLSCEPLLGPVDLNEVPRPDNAYFTQRGERGCITDPNEPDDYVYWHKRDQIHWVVVGGESGHNARPMHPDWARSLRDQCQAAGVAFHFKQWGEWMPVHPDRKSFEYSTPASKCTEVGDTRFYRIGKQKAGRILDGRTWDEFPESK